MQYQPTFEDIMAGMKNKFSCFNNEQKFNLLSINSEWLVCFYVYNCITYFRISLKTQSQKDNTSDYIYVEIPGNNYLMT